MTCEESEKKGKGRVVVEDGGGRGFRSRTARRVLAVVTSDVTSAFSHVISDERSASAARLIA